MIPIKNKQEPAAAGSFFVYGDSAAAGERRSSCKADGIQQKRHPIGCLFHGADDQIRTDYLVLTKDALYLLSYISKDGRGRRT